jgi:hypothetical protein
MAGATVPAVSGIAADLSSAPGVDRLLTELGKVSSESGLNIPTEMVHYDMTKTARRRTKRRKVGPWSTPEPIGVSPHLFKPATFRARLNMQIANVGWVHGMKTKSDGAW